MSVLKEDYEKILSLAREIGSLCKNSRPFNLPKLSEILKQEESLLNKTAEGLKSVSPEEASDLAPLVKRIAAEHKRLKKRIVKRKENLGEARVLFKRFQENLRPETGSLFMDRQA